MIAKTRLKLIIACIALLAISAIGLIAGCGEQSLDEYLDEMQAHEAVTYYANSGTFDGKANVVEKTIYYQDGAPIIYDFSVSNTISVERTGYIFNGWLKAKLDSDGKPVYDDNGNLIATDEVIDLSTTKLQKGEHIYVCANWTRGAYLQIILVTESDDALIGEDEKEYHSGDVITEMTFGTNTSILITEASSPFASTNYTYLQYYSDSECTQPFSGSFAKPDDESTAVLYAKYIKGTYTIVRDRSGARDMFNYMRSKNYYFFNTSEEKVIDMSGVSLSLKTGTTEFDIKVEGNGFTLKNLSYSVTTVSTQNVIYSMFGKFTSDAEINNLNIENVNVTLTTVRPTVTSLSIYLVCNGAEEGTKFSNFAIGDITLEITTIRDTSNIVNMPKADGVYSTANSCFGGVANDEEFLSAHSGITVSNVTLQIGSN